MKSYLELWNAKPTWKALSQEERGNYMAQIGPAVQQLLDGGAEIICWGVNQGNTYQRAAYDYFAVWNFPNQESIENFEKLVVDAGWYNYFEQVNVCGTATTPEEVIGKMIAI